MARFFKIRTKDGRLINFKLNDAQKRFYEVIKQNWGKKPLRIIVLKARQLGMSTFTEGIITYSTITSRNTDALIVAHDSTASTSIYNMTKLFISELPEPLKPKQKYNNGKMITFDSDDGKGLKSSIKVGVPNDSVRGQTYRFAHLSEVAFWEHPEEAMLAVLQCVPNDPKSIIVIESTANGFNDFYDRWSKAERGENGYIPLFFPWYENEEYHEPYTGFELTEYEKDIKEKYHLTDDQLQWRRNTIANQCGGDEERFRQEYPISPEEAFIVSGSSIFNNEIVLKRMKEVTPGERGRFVYDYDGLSIRNIRWIKDPNGFITIYQHPQNPFHNRVETVIGADTAGDGEDYFAAHVLTREGKQIAVLHHQMDEDLFTKQIYCLGMYYSSLVGIEANFSTFPNMELQRLRYPWIYVRAKYDQIQNDVQSRFGFRTTVLTRPIIISNLVEIVREHTELIVDRSTLQEMLSFVWLDGKQQASEGAHDDLVMSLAIGYEVLKQIPIYRQREHKEEIYDSFITYGG